MAIDRRCRDPSSTEFHVMRTFSKLIGCLLLALVCASAFAEDHRVTVGGATNVFTPKTLTINAGDTVTFVSAGGFHNVVANDNSFTNGAASQDPFTFVHKFDTAGTFGY